MYNDWSCGSEVQWSLYKQTKHPLNMWCMSNLIYCSSDFPIEHLKTISNECISIYQQEQKHASNLSFQFDDKSNEIIIPNLLLPQHYDFLNLFVLIFILLWKGMKHLFWYTRSTKNRNILYYLNVRFYSFEVLPNKLK